LDGDVCLAVEEFPDVFGIAVKTVEDEGLSDPEVFDLVGEKTTGNCSDLVGVVGAAVDEAMDREKP